MFQGTGGTTSCGIFLAVAQCFARVEEGGALLASRYSRHLLLRQFPWIGKVS